MQRAASLLGVVGGTLATTCYVVDAGTAVVKFSKLNGVNKHTFSEGLHFKIPFIETPIRYDIRVKPREIETRTGTKDQQTVSIKLRVLHQPVVEELPWMYENYGLDYDERILPSIGHEVMKAVVAKFNAEELITKRREVSDAVSELMSAKAIKSYNLELRDISLVDLVFSKEFMTAVEQKQVAGQDAARWKFVVEKNEQEKLAMITRAEGEAKAAELVGGALSRVGPGFVELREIEAARDIAKTLSSNPDVSYVPSKAGVLLGMASTPSQPRPPPRK